MKKPKKRVVAKVSAELVQTLQELNQTIEQAQAKKREIQDMLLAKMGESEWGDYGDSTHILRHLTVHRAEYTVPATTYQTLRVVKREVKKDVK